METAYSPDQIKTFREEKYNSIKWIEEEILLQNERKYMEHVFPKYQFSFTSAILYKLRKSIFGKYLDVFNLPQNQDKELNENKLGITQWDVKRMGPKELESFEHRNKIIEDYFNVLKDAVHNCEVINLDYIYNTIKKLGINRFYINLIDGDLRNFVNLRILTLTGNNLKQMRGSTLPRKLLFLELYDNFISDLTKFVKNAPRTLIHLGLGRNKLTDNSAYHLLAESGNFHRLRSLDLSDNDIFNLEAVVSKFVELNALTSLSLEGNPCSVVIAYKDIILSYVPDLLFLDNVEILIEDRNITDNFEDDGKRAQMVFMCHRIMGLPKPPKDKKAKQFVYLEVELPLLEEVHFPEPESDPITGKETNKKNKKGGDEKSAKSKKSGKGKKSPYARPTEYDPIAEKNNFNFKTERVLWNKIIKFPPVFIESPEGNIVSIRDTFKSVVNVRVVYLKVLPPQKQKKGSKKDKKSKKSKKESKSSKKKGKSDKGKGDKPKEPVIPEIPQEVIQKKVTLCSFDCVLKPVNWSDETVDFYWADHKLITTKALQLDGCLKAVNYGEKGSKREKKGKSSAGTATTDGKSSKVKNAVPKIFTCQVGFGLSRSVVPVLQ